MIGRVTSYQPPTVGAFTWRAPSWGYDTEVEVRFLGEGTGTRIEPEDRGWEQDPKILDTRKNYDGGWETVFRQYSAHASLAM